MHEFEEQKGDKSICKTNLKKPTPTSKSDIGRGVERERENKIKKPFKKSTPTTISFQLLSTFSLEVIVNIRRRG